MNRRRRFKAKQRRYYARQDRELCARMGMSREDWADMNYWARESRDGQEFVATFPRELIEIGRELSR